MGGIFAIPGALPRNINVLTLEAPKAPEARQVRGAFGVPTNRVDPKEQAAYAQALKDYNAKQNSAHRHYSSLWDTNPSKFVNTLRTDLEAGKITKEYYDWQFRDKDKQKFRTQVESQAAAKAAHEKALAQQREAAKQAELASQRMAQQQRTLQNIETGGESASAEVVRGGGDTVQVSTGSGRRRRGARLSSVLGI